MNKKMKRDMQKATIVSNLSSPIATIPSCGCLVDELDTPLVVSNPSQGKIVTDDIDNGPVIFNGFALDTNDYMYKRYQFVMSTPVSDLNKQGYWIDERGWIQKNGDDFLPLPNVIDISNSLGESGKLHQRLEAGGISHKQPSASAISTSNGYGFLLWYAVAAVAVIIIYYKFIRK